MPLKFFNTLTKEKEEFVPIDANEVRMYTCGPTVYYFAHIGNLRSYVFADILRRTIKYSGYEVKQVMNITDIGHLVSDADAGDDKMTKGLLREGKELTLQNMREMAEFYTEKFNHDLERLNIEMPDGQYFASDYVAEDIALIQRLEEKGYTYKTSDGIYFDTEKCADYGKLIGKEILEWDIEGARITQTGEKKRPIDFALWKLDSKLGYESPFGKGFPGWHIECSAMGIKFLGEQFDIHTGGIDHIPIHHTNEIAQSESATGKKPFVRFWMHHEFIDTGGNKMAKSEGNFLRLDTLIEKGISPITYRFWLLMASYHTKMNFSFEALEASEIALKRLYRLYNQLGEEMGKTDENYKQKFKERIENDLDTSRALSLLWDLIKDENILNANKKATILDFDRVLGLNFSAQGGPVSGWENEPIPNAIQLLVTERENARKNKNFQKSDALRKEINDLGYEVKDSEIL
ncbi:MAG: Cysteine-tRNA ligase [Candidatus Nomurabacteria bacterium GW2011_GWA2_40_9]|uniref:Cysteine--tRNA ligase n=1 Tax=Candidatus Nomurabacteria bacterium GW2011_GWA2_40_9 TaxID=1618734 RepID=A0A0G0TYH8_9BACT|nr:MAG: Cysteine-tRNA ligase [Candidatus Nomurabacteria bacterium GW2011_GWA2_40_9]